MTPDREWDILESRLLDAVFSDFVDIFAHHAQVSSPSPTPDRPHPFPSEHVHMAAAEAAWAALKVARAIRAAQTPSAPGKLPL